MFKYRSGEYDPTPYINKIEDEHIKVRTEAGPLPFCRHWHITNLSRKQGLIRHMIQLDPSKRMSADRYLAEW